LAFSGIAVAAWSIYTQAVKLKQYCALCLSIVAVLVLQSITALFIIQQFILNEISSSVYIGFGSFIALFFILALVLLPTKQLIKTNNSNKLKLAELKKWKLDAGLFINQWQQEQEVDTAIWANDLLIGNPFAPLLITVACNPYCGPCAKAHQQLDNLLHRFANKLKVQIRLLCNAENENDKKTVAVKAILQKAATIKTNSDLQQMLTDWFERMDYEKWDAKWKSDNTINVNKRLQEHSKWVVDSAIAFTPTFFINGKKLPGRYNLDDIEILIPQLTEMMNKEINVNN
jgi:protein-disulfide isomerase